MFNFVMKKMLQRQLKGVPKEQQELIMAAVEKNPKLFQNIAKEIKAKTKSGTDEQTATMRVLMDHKQELQQLMQEIYKK